MNDLPKKANTQNTQTSQPVIPSASSVSGKESESAPSSELPVQEIQKELELPKEIVSVGVKTQPTVVNIPKPVSQMGVKPAGANVSLGSGSTVSLPLTQQQIVQGLQRSILDSWRWLAVWCVRRLKQLRFFQMKQ